MLTLFVKSDEICMNDDLIPRNFALIPRSKRLKELDIGHFTSRTSFVIKTICILFLDYVISTGLVYNRICVILNTRNFAIIILYAQTKLTLN